MKLDEALKIIKKEYENFKHDPYPNIVVIDNNYKGKYILGYNINYFSDRKKAKEKLEKILKFAKKAKLNKLDTYKEIKKQFPESNKYIRTYKKEKIK